MVDFGHYLFVCFFWSVNKGVLKDSLGIVHRYTAGVLLYDKVVEPIEPVAWIYGEADLALLYPYSADYDYPMLCLASRRLLKHQSLLSDKI